jgi:ribonuclease BN (tRNA processing enzyme)
MNWNGKLGNDPVAEGLKSRSRPSAYRVVGRPPPCFGIRRFHSRLRALDLSSTCRRANAEILTGCGLIGSFRQTNQFRGSTMRLQFLGSGDAFGSGGRFNTCFLVESRTGAFLIDCGASSLVAIRKAGVDPNRIATVFVSHLHGDHFGGLPFLILDAQFYSRRTAPLTLVGPAGLRDRLTQATEVFFPGSSTAERRFATEIREIEARQTVVVNGVEVTAYRVEHACGAPPFALRFACDGKILAYTGDTQWTNELLAAGRNADLLIAEALCFERRVRYHLDYTTLKANLARIGAKRVILTHMGPEMLAHLGDVPEEVADDGRIIEI